MIVDCRTPIAEFHVLMLAMFTWRRAFENFEFYPKMSLKLLFIYYFLKFHLKLRLIFSLFKTKIEEKLPKQSNFTIF